MSVSLEVMISFYFVISLICLYYIILTIDKIFKVLYSLLEKNISVDEN